MFQKIPGINICQSLFNYSIPMQNVI